MLDRIAAHVSEHRTTLVFVNTRRLAERLAHQLGERLGDDVVAAHHGSLSKDRRYRVEPRLRAGELKALVATASLELGIDIGPVELVCQIGSPRSIATFLQRVGRSNHTRAGRAQGPPVSADPRRAGRVRGAARRRARRSARRDRAAAACRSTSPRSRSSPRSAAQEWRTDDLFALVRRAAPYRDLTREQFDEVIDLVGQRRRRPAAGRAGATCTTTRSTARCAARKGARLAALTSGGAIPETGDYRVVAEPDDTFIGTVNEDWAVESMAGDIFLLGTHSWQIRRVEAGRRARARRRRRAPPTIPFWIGEAPARTDRALGRGVGSCGAGVDALLAAGDPDGAPGLARRHAGVDDDAATMIVDYLAVGRAVLGVMPDARHASCSSGSSTRPAACSSCIHSPYGGRINRAFGLALRKKFCRTFNFELQAAATDNAIVLSLGPHHSFPLEEVPRYVHSDTVDETLEHAVLDSPMFHRPLALEPQPVAARAALPGRPPATRRRSSAWRPTTSWPRCSRKRPRARRTSTGPIEIPDHLIVRQTIDDTLHEALDVDGLRALLDAIEAGDGARALRRHHRAVGARPRDPHRAPVRVPRRRRAPEPAHQRGAPAARARRRPHVDRRARARRHRAGARRDHARPEPARRAARPAVLAGASSPGRDEWRALFGRARGRGAAREIVDARRRATLWCTTEIACRCRARRSPATTTAVTAVRARPPRAGRRHHRRRARGRAALPLPVGSPFGLAALEQRRLRDRRAATPTDAAEQTREWVARRLLARMHSYSRRSRRATASSRRRPRTSCGSSCGGSTSRPARSSRATTVSRR